MLLSNPRVMFQLFMLTIEHQKAPLFLSIPYPSHPIPFTSPPHHHLFSFAIHSLLVKIMILHINPFLVSQMCFHNHVAAFGRWLTFVYGINFGLFLCRFIGQLYPKYVQGVFLTGPPPVQYRKENRPMSQPEAFLDEESHGTEAPTG